MNVTIFGGGMAGAQLARSLEQKNIHVTIVDPLDYFEIKMSVPRSIVEPDFSQRAMIPFAGILEHGTHIQAKLVELIDKGASNAPNARVLTAAGEETIIETGDLAILSTGTQFASPIFTAPSGGVNDRRTYFTDLAQKLKASNDVLIVGGGAIGVEVAGELVETYPSQNVTIVESSDRLLSRSSEKVGQKAQSFLEEKGARIITGQRVSAEHGPNGAGVQGPGQATLTNGEIIAYDAIIWAVGGRPNTSYMTQNFSTVLNNRGQIQVAPTLFVKGYERIMAIGDVTDLDENKMAAFLSPAVKGAVANALALQDNLANGKTVEYAHYKPKTGDQTMIVSLGKNAGIAQMGPVGPLSWSWLLRKLKSSEMLVPRFRGFVGQ